MNGLARNAKGHWVATHMGQRVTFTEQRFGDAAELLARRVLLAMLPSYLPAVSCWRCRPVHTTS